MFNGKQILITGGTGSFGKETVRTILRDYKPKRLIIFSRDELKQFEMSQTFSPQEHGCLRYFLGDVRDAERIHRAFKGVDYVIHAAAMKQVPSSEYNPFECIKTNILGAQNIIDAALANGVKKVIALSTDKAANPVNLYGATKLCSDKLFIAANVYSGAQDTSFAVVRYGNVVGSRGSVVPFFMQKRKEGVLPITDPRMTRFWITLEQGIQFVFSSLDMMVGGELFVPKIPSMKIVELAKAIAPECELKTVGIRPGEKLHEVMVPVDEARNTIDIGDRYVIKPTFDEVSERYAVYKGEPLPVDFEYNSRDNSEWITREKLCELVGL